MEGSACTGCPETLLGGAERKGRGISKGYFCLYFLRLIHLGPKARHVLPAARDTAGPPLSPGGWGRGGGAYIVFFSITLLEPRARLFPAVLSRGTQLAAAPEEGAATGPPTHTLPLVSPPRPFTLGASPLWDQATHTSCGGLRPERAVEVQRGPSAASSLQESREAGWRQSLLRALLTGSPSSQGPYS